MPLVYCPDTEQLTFADGSEGRCPHHQSSLRAAPSPPRSGRKRPRSGAVARGPSASKPGDRPGGVPLPVPDAEVLRRVS
eukprot:9197004-Lingulodinium_polyedra.AAC.1